MSREWRRCPGRCGVQVRTGPACPTCWARVPNELRLPAEHAARNRGPGRHADEHVRRLVEDARDWLLEHPAEPNPDAAITAWCECGAQILWLTTAAGARMPVDAKPDPERGNVVRTGPHAGVLGAQAATAARAAGTPLWLHHRATCPQASMWSDAGSRRKARR